MRARGFTLVELMLTVALIGIMAVIAVPAAMQAIQRREAAVAAQSVLDFVEYARTQASLRSRAYELRILPAGGRDGTILFQIVEGTGPACLGFDPVGVAGIEVRTLDLQVEFPTVRMVSMAPADLVVSPICFKPDGRVFQVVGDATPRIIPAIEAGFAAGEARLRFQRINRDSGFEGPRHVVIIPFNGSTRLTFE